MQAEINVELDSERDEIEFVLTMRINYDQYVMLVEWAVANDFIDRHDIDQAHNSDARGGIAETVLTHAFLSPELLDFLSEN